jgi:DNA modification methylase
MKYPEDFINKLICTDCLEGMRYIPTGSIDLIVTDPPYGYAFMQRNWDRALVSIGTWKECLRILKPGAFAFIMCAPRQDVLSRQIINLEEAGFITGFTSLYWAYGSGFPKAQDISKAIDKRECKKQLIKELGRKPTKEEFDRKWKSFREFVGYGKDISHIERGDSNIDIQKREDTGNPFKHTGLRHLRKVTAPNSQESRILDGSYGGFQPKPAVEVILMVMKPLSEKTYMDQALKNGKGITWLDDGRIPYKEKNDFKISHHNKHLKEKNKSTGIFGATNGFGLLESDISRGRFPANLLVSNDTLNDGKISRSGKNRKSNQLQKNQWLKKSIYYDSLNYGDSGSFSRYFDLDKWWRERSKKLSKQPCFICGYVEEHGNYIDADGRTYCDECLISGDYLDIPKLNIKELPESVQKTYPYLIVPKASKSEKNKGCERLEEKARANINKMMGEAGDFKTGSGNIRTVKFKNHHPTVKPIKLMSYLIILGSRPNDIILDPFVGSGTTCIAAKMLKRRYIGFDNDKEYIEIAKCRLGTVETTLF